MATVQEPRTGNRFESFVEAELGRASRRIQSQDIGAAALGLLAGTLAYAVGMVLLDRWLDLSDTARQLGLFAYLAVAATCAAFVLSRPLRRRVNPYFAARQVERAVPGAKNSVISWLDLHAEPLPESIRSAVSQKAAADIKKADVDEVVRDSRLAWIGSIAGGLFVAALILFFLLRPNQFLSLLGRAFTPFGSSAIASQTSFNLQQPAGGDVTVPVNSAVDFRVDVLGRVPDPAANDAVRLQFRYNPADPVWEEIRLAPSPRDPREFSVRMPGGRVQNGFEYQIVGGDAATLRFNVRVRSSPLIEGFDVGYHYPTYRHAADKTDTNPNIVALRGTKVTLTARTNRNLKNGMLTFLPIHDGQAMPTPIPAEPVPDQPASLRFHFDLTDDAKYQINFQSLEGERNEDPIPYTIKVEKDAAPHVEITRAAPPTLPVNGTIAVEGRASDDFGLTAMRLCLRIPDGDQIIELTPKPYRPGKVFKFADDTFPRNLDYKDFLPLEQLKTKLGAAVALKPKLVIEYWLEAEDNCDNPAPNVGKSDIHKVTLDDPQEPADKQAAEQQAAGDKAEHDQKQDQDLARENEAKKQAADKNEQSEPSGDKANEQPKESDKNNKRENNPAEAAKQQQLERQMQKAQEALDKQQQQQRNGKSQAKGGSQQQAGPPETNPGQPKGEPGSQDSKPQNQPGQAKPRQGDAKSDPNAGKPQPNDSKNDHKDNGQPDPGAAKPQPDSQKPDGQNGNPKPTEPNNPSGGPPDGKQSDQKQTKPTGAQQPKPNEGGQPDNQKPQAKDSAESKPQPQAGPANAGEKNQPPQGNPQSAKDGQPNNQKSQPKDSGDKSGHPQNQADSGENKPQPQSGAASAGEKKEPSQGNPQTGEQKPGGSDQKTGPDGSKRSGEPNAGAPQKQNQPGQPNGKAPDQPPNGQGDKRQTTENRTPSENPMKTESGDNSKPKPEPGKGGDAGKKDQTGERPGDGPKKDPNNRQPNGQPNSNDPGREGAGSKAGSNQPGDGTPKEKNQRDVPNGKGQGGAPDLGEAKPSSAPADGSNKGEAKPSAGEPGDAKSGQPGGDPTGQGDLQNAAKPHEQAGNASKSTPKTEGTPSANQASGNKSNEPAPGNEQNPAASQAGVDQKVKDEVNKLAHDLQSKDAATRQAAENRVKEMAKELAKQSTGQKSPDENAVKAATEQAKELLKDLDENPGARQALENAMKNAAQEIGKEELQKLAQDLKSGDAKTRDSAKERAKQLAQGGMKPLADDAKSNDPQRQQKTDDFLKENVEKDPAARQALMDALKGEPTDQNDDQRTANSRLGFTGQVPKRSTARVPDSELGTTPAPKNANTTSDLQLERFPKNPSKELLQDLDMTEEQYRQFLKDAAELQKKRDAEAKNNRERGVGRGSSAANSGVKRVQAAGDKKDNLERGGASLPPEEYREGYKGFTEDVSKTTGGAKKE